MGGGEHARTCEQLQTMSGDPVQREKDQQRHMWEHLVCMAGHSADGVVGAESGRASSSSFWIGLILGLPFGYALSLKGHSRDTGCFLATVTRSRDKEQSDRRAIYLGDTVHLREKSNPS